MKRVASVLFIVVGFAIIITGVIVYSQKNVFSQPGDAELPKSLVGLRLENSIFGRTAVNEIVRLHDGAFPLTSGAAGSYGGNGEVKLWAAGTESGVSASKLVSAMRDAISAGDSPFQPINETSLKGRKVYYLTGMGQRHYYFRAGSMVVWLAAEPDLADQVLEEVLEFYP